MKQLYTSGTDRWLTPPGLVTALGPFDLDPCCEPWMPWRTAARMLCKPADMEGCEDAWVTLPDDVVRSEPLDGLEAEWSGRVWMNHPYSKGLPWAEKFIAHGDGVALTAAKSTDTRWGQALLENFDLALFLAGRILFHYPNGTLSAGRWLPNVLWAIGKRNCDALRALDQQRWPGVLVARVG